MKNLLFFLILFYIFCTGLNAQDVKKSQEIDPDIESKLVVWISEGFVSNEEVAIKIAEAVLVNVYGEQVLENRPFIATLTNDGTVWYIKGTFPHSDGYWAGGVPHIKIAKSDGRILGFIHGK